MTRVRADEDGFTLVEVLVGLAITGLCATLFLLVVGGVGLSVRRSTQSDDRLGPVRDAQFVLADRIARMRPLTDAQTASTVDMAGRPDSLDFVADNAGTDTPDASQRFRITRDPAGTLALYRLSTLDTATDAHAPETSRWHKLGLLAETTGLVLGYYGLDPVTRQPAWQREWTHRGALPLLVRISVRFADGDARHWPDLVIRPRAANGDSCERLARSGSCLGES